MPLSRRGLGRTWKILHSMELCSYISPTLQVLSSSHPLLRVTKYGDVNGNMALYRRAVAVGRYRCMSCVVLDDLCAMWFWPAGSIRHNLAAFTLPGVQYSAGCNMPSLDAVPAACTTQYRRHTTSTSQCDISSTGLRL